MHVCIHYGVEMFLCGKSVCTILFMLHQHSPCSFCDSLKNICAQMLLHKDYI